MMFYTYVSVHTNLIYCVCHVCIVAHVYMHIWRPAVNSEAFQVASTSFFEAGPVLSLGITS